MSPSAPPAAARKRPWYLVVALVVVSILGALGLTEGLAIVSEYRGGHIDATQLLAGVELESDRTAILDALDRREQALEDEKSKLFPLAVAELLLGAAMFGLSAGAMAGRPGARASLVQVVAVHAALVIATWVLTPRTRYADRAANVAQANAGLHMQHNDPEVTKQTEAMTPMLAVGRDAVVLMFSTMVSVLVIVALTRKRALEFYEPAAEG